MSGRGKRLGKNLCLPRRVRCRLLPFSHVSPRVRDTRVLEGPKSINTSHSCIHQPRQPNTCVCETTRNSSVDMQVHYRESGCTMSYVGRITCVAEGFNTEYLDPSSCWLLVARGGSGSASCPANRGRLEIEGMGRLSYMCCNDRLLGVSVSHWW